MLTRIKRHVIITTRHAQNSVLNIKERMVITALKKTRVDKGIYQEDLSRKANVALRTLQYYESGERRPDVDTAQRLAKTLGVRVEDLFLLPGESANLDN